jgi:hypothetical protein
MLHFISRTNPLWSAKGGSSPRFALKFTGSTAERVLSGLQPSR